MKGGAHVANVHFKDLPSELKSKNISGFHIGPTAEWTIPVVGLGLDFSLLYSKMGMDIGNTTIKSDYLDIPLNLKWKIGIPAAKVFVAAGPFVGFRLGGGKIWEVISNQIEAKTFSAGLNMGGGVELIQHLQIGVNYHLGMTDNYSIAKLGSDGKNRGWQISAALLF